jgi:pimeloyl-ACP methyl ester carboxylesterase
VNAAGLTWQTVTVDGQGISCASVGSGPPVVLVHGLSASAHWWDRNIGDLARHFSVHVIDLPGFGRNRHLTLLELDLTAGWIVRWLDAVGLPQVDLIGHSMGGYLSIQVAAMYPDQVRRLVLVDPVVRPFVRPYSQPIVRLAAELTHVPRRFLPTVARDFVRAGFSNVRRAAHSVVRADARPLLPSIESPTLVVWGSRDSLLLADGAAEIGEALPDARVQILQGAGHTPMWEQPDVFNQLTIAFLNQGVEPEALGTMPAN